MKRICTTRTEATMVVSGCAFQDSILGVPCTLLHVGIASNSTNTKNINADRVGLGLAFQLATHRVCFPRNGLVEACRFSRVLHLRHRVVLNKNAGKAG